MKNLDYESIVQDLLRNASRFKRFPVSKENLIKFLNFLYEHQPIDLWDYTKMSDEYVRVILSLLFVLEKEKFVSIDVKGGMSLTRKGMGLAKHLFIKKGPKPFVKIAPRHGLVLTPKFKKILRNIKVLYKDITPQNRFDQAPLVPESAVYKAAYTLSKGDATHKSIVCVGDDDLVSVTLALSKAPNRILAVDIDKYLLETIEEYSEKNKLKIETLQQDLKKPIPEEYRNKFDLFITEPPDTVNGTTLFVSRGIDFLKDTPGMIGYCGVSVTACPPLGLLQIQKNFNKMNLRVLERLPKYDDYPPHRTELKHVEVPDCYNAFYPPKKVWYSADLVRLKTTKATKPFYKGAFKGKLANYREDAMKYQ